MTTDVLVVTEYTDLNGTVIINGSPYVPVSELQGTPNQINVATTPAPENLLGVVPETKIELANEVFAPGSLGAKSYGCVGCDASPTHTQDGDFTAESIYSANLTISNPFPLPLYNSSNGGYDPLLATLEPGKAYYFYDTGINVNSPTICRKDLDQCLPEIDTFQFGTTGNEIAMITENTGSGQKSIFASLVTQPFLAPGVYGPLLIVEYDSKGRAVRASNTTGVSFNVTLSSYPDQITITYTNATNVVLGLAAYGTASSCSWANIVTDDKGRTTCTSNTTPVTSFTAIAPLTQGGTSTAPTVTLPSNANITVADAQLSRLFVNTPISTDPSAVVRVKADSSSGTEQAVIFSQANASWNRGFVYIENNATLLTADTMRMRMNNGARGLFIEQNADAGSFIIDATKAPNLISGPQQTVMAIGGNNTAFSMVKLENYARSTTNNANFVVVNYDLQTTAAGIAVVQYGQGPAFWAAVTNGGDPVLQADNAMRGINIQTKNSSYNGGYAAFFYSEQDSALQGYVHIEKQATSDTNPLLYLYNNVSVNAPMISSYAGQGTAIVDSGSKFGVFSTQNTFSGGYAAFYRSTMTSSIGVGFFRLQRTSTSDASPLLTCYNSGTGDSLAVLSTDGLSTTARIKPSGQIWGNSFWSNPSTDFDIYAGTNGAIALKVTNAAAMANGARIVTAQASGSITYTVQGTDTNIPVLLASKGSGTAALSTGNVARFTCAATTCNTTIGVALYQGANQVIDTLVAGTGITITGSGNTRTISVTALEERITWLEKQLEDLERFLITRGR